MGKWEKGRTQAAEKFKRRAGMRQHKEHPRGPGERRKAALAMNKAQETQIKMTGQKYGRQGRGLQSKPS